MAKNIIVNFNSFIYHIRWFGTPSLYECITGNLYDNKFKSLGGN